MTRNEHNGWYNWETWSAALYLDDEDFLSSLSPSDTLSEVKERIVDWLDYRAEEASTAHPLLCHVWYCFQQECNVQELAEHYYDEISNYETEEDEDDES